LFTRENEIKVGITVFLAMVVLIGVILVVGRFNFFEKGYTFSLIFNFVSGLKPKTGVYLAGIKVGYVQDVEIKEKNGKNFVLVKIWLPEKIKIRKNAHFYINTLGLMGEKYIDIAQGTDDTPLITPGEVLRGKDPVHYALLGAKIEKISHELHNLVKRLAGDEKARSKIKEVIENTVQITRQLNKILDDQHLGGVVGDFKKVSTQLKRSLNTIEETFNHFNTLIKTNRQNLEITLSKLKTITTEKEKEIKSTLDNLATVSHRLNLLTQEISQGKGTLGKLIQDEEIYKNLLSITRSAEELVKDLKKHPWKLLKKK
jgi:phospholipid/cholesterol/gamma-HCH transport system substrate-binding protein